jgi:hypothetical protein
VQAEFQNGKVAQKPGMHRHEAAMTDQDIGAQKTGFQ